MQLERIAIENSYHLPLLCFNNSSWKPILARLFFTSYAILDC